jgi:hypothetical protein
MRLVVSEGLAAFTMSGTACTSRGARSSDISSLFAPLEFDLTRLKLGRDPLEELEEPNDIERLIGGALKTW